MVEWFNLWQHCLTNRKDDTMNAVEVMISKVNDSNVEQAFAALVEQVMTKHGEALTAVQNFIMKHGADALEECISELDEYTAKTMRCYMPVWDKPAKGKPAKAPETKAKARVRIAEKLVEDCKKAGVSVDSVLKALGYDIG